MKGMKNDHIKIDDTLVLTSDFPRYNLSRGQVGTVIEILDDGSLFLLKFSDDEREKNNSYALFPYNILLFSFKPVFL